MPQHPDFAAGSQQVDCSAVEQHGAASRSASLLALVFADSEMRNLVSMMTPYLFAFLLAA